MRDRIHHWKRPVFIAGLCLACLPAYSQFGAEGGGGRKVTRVGGVVAGFLGDPIGGPTDAMADAQAAVPQGLLTLEGNPAHAALIGRWEYDYSDPSLDRDDQHFTFRAGFAMPGIGTLAAGVRTQRGISRRDWAVSLTAGRRMSSWLAVGATIRGIRTSTAWEYVGGADWDAGVLVMPSLLSRTGKPDDGLKIGFSLCNMELGVIDSRVRSLTADVVDFPMAADWPMVLRIGLSVVPVASETNRLTLAADAVHPNDGFESLNFGMEDRFTARKSMELAVRLGLRFIEGEADASAGLGACWTAANGQRFEAGYSWMNEPVEPDRHGIYFRIFR
jgi:hypothetical protein